MSWPSFFGGVFLTIAIGILGWGLWAHNVNGMIGLVVGVMAWGCLVTACEKEDK
jgi:hypothetical protein